MPTIASISIHNMNRATFFLLIGFVFSMASASEPLNFWMAKPDVLVQKITENAMSDFREIVSGKPPTHAKLDNGAPIPADGGTSYFKADGYSLTIVKSLVRVAGVDGYMYGPVIRFDKSIAVGNSNTISQVNFYSMDELKKLLQISTR